MANPHSEFYEIAEEGVPVNELRLEIMAVPVNRVHIHLWRKVVQGVPRDQEGALDRSELFQRFSEIITYLTELDGHKVISGKHPRYGIIWAVLNKYHKWTLIFPEDYGESNEKPPEAPLHDPCPKR